MQDFDDELTTAEGRIGAFIWNVYLSCGWQPEKEFDNWSIERMQRMADYVEGKWSPPKRSIEELEVPSDD